MYLLKILSYTSLFLLFFNSAIYCKGFASKGKAFTSFVIYLVSLFIIQSLADVYASQGMNNHFFASYLLFIPFILLSFFFYYLLADIRSKKKNVVRYVSVVTTLGLFIQYCLHPDIYFTFNSIGLLITSCIIILYAVMYLFELLSQKLPFHYVTVGIFIYYLSSCLIFVSAPSIASFNVEISIFIWKINAILFIVYQLLILWEWKQTFYHKPTRQD